jgi:hypothetical protein
VLDAGVEFPPGRPQLGDDGGEVIERAGAIVLPLMRHQACVHLVGVETHELVGHDSGCGTGHGGPS